MRFLTLAPKVAFEPLDTILTSVFILLYPIPEFITTASMILPFSIIGLMKAPVPVVSETTILGAEK